MKALFETAKEVQLTLETTNLRKKFHEARAEYELALRRSVLNRVENCPCCFENLYDNMKDRVKNQAFYSNFDPDELKVLEEMYFYSGSNAKSEGKH